MSSLKVDIGIRNDKAQDRGHGLCPSPTSHWGVGIGPHGLEAAFRLPNYPTWLSLESCKINNVVCFSGKLFFV